MEALRIHRFRRVWLAATLFIGGLIACPFTAGKASADISVCITDPVVLLSNGTMVDITAMIADQAADVKHVAYTLDAPAGTSVVAVMHSPGSIATVESFQFRADNGPGRYDSTALVTTGASGVPVTLMAAGSGLGSGSATGTSGQSLAVHLVGSS
ncbi:MAG: hypothetical protein JOZ41_13880 [Chloroflexi bacterium]|nr:hypothetical protein [Chloroflexota bacterium]